MPFFSLTDDFGFHEDEDVSKLGREDECFSSVLHEHLLGLRREVEEHVLLVFHMCVHDNGSSASQKSPGSCLDAVLPELLDLSAVHSKTFQ